MKLTATWNENEGEGNLSKADVARLLEQPSMREADFLRDVLFDVTNLYNEVCDKVFPGRIGSGVGDRSMTNTTADAIERGEHG